MGLIAGLLVLVAGPAHAEGPLVLVKADAALFSQPDGDEEKARLVKGVDLEAAPHRVFYAELVARHEGWVAVRTSVHRHACVKQLGNNPPIGLVLWVKPGDLVPVLQRPVTLDVGGVTAQVSPGVPMRSNVDGTWTAAVEGLQVTGIFPEDAIGQKFEPVEQPDSSFRGTHLATGGFGAEKLRITANQTPATQRGETWTMERRCLSVSGPQLDGDPPVPGSPTNDGGGARRVEHQWLIPAESTLTWPDGMFAGVTVNAFRLEDDQQPDPAGRHCGPSLGDLILCTDDPAAAEKPPPPRYPAVQLEPRARVEVKHPKGDVKGEAAKCRAQIDLDPKGKVHDVTVRACPEAFAAAAKEAVLQWSYPPFEVNGKPVPARTWTWIAFEP